MSLVQEQYITHNTITDQEFALFQALIYKEAGIYLSQTKKALLVGRLAKRLQELSLKSFLAYYRYVAEQEEELINLLDRICTNETHFFREPHQFDFIRQHIFPDWSAKASKGLMQKRIRVWSAACSTGEEPYSIAMQLLDHFPPSVGWEISIIATDLSTRVLAKAQEAMWPINKAQEIPNHYLKRFMLKGTRTQEGKMKASPEIRSIVEFQRMNLNDDIYSVIGPFDLIFCRNVLIYFNLESKTRVIKQLLNNLSSTGYLFLGHSESLQGLTRNVQCVAPTVYVKTH